MCEFGRVSPTMFRGEPNECLLRPQWPVVHPEDSGVYICQAENNEGVTEVKVEIIVEGGLGAPVASVSATEMTVVEGHTVTMECRASGKVLAALTHSLSHTEQIAISAFCQCLGCNYDM